MSNIVIFGGSGFLAEALLEQIPAKYFFEDKNVLIVGRNEANLVAMKEKFPTVKILVGDIADKWVVKKAMYRADEIYLLAAMKHVGLAESDVSSCIKSNVIGVMNILEESLLQKPRFIIFTSTDKAGKPTGVYGCTKKLSERLFAEAEQMNPDTKYRVVRYGNVFGSSGSFITKWIPKMKNGEEIILSDPDATRFFFTVTDAVNLIFECLEKATDATPYIPKMKAISMGRVLEACQEVYGKCPVKIIGLQAGENKVETIDGVTFSDEVQQYSKEEFKQKFLYGKD